MTNGRCRVRFILASRSRSINWLNAPALAEEKRIARAKTITFHVSGMTPGVIAIPARPVTIMATPILSLNTDSVFFNTSVMMHDIAVTSAVARLQQDISSSRSSTIQML